MGIVEDSFGLNLKIIRLLGLWPTQNHKKLYKTFAHAIYFLVTLPMPISAAIYLLITEDVDVEKFTNTTFVMAQFGCFIFKLRPFLKNPQALKSCVYKLNSSVFSASRSQKHLEVVADCTGICRKVSRIFVFICFNCCTIWSTEPWLRSGRSLQIELWLPFDPTSGYLVFYAVFIYLAVVAYCGAVQNASIDVLVAGLACHASGQIKILKDNLQNLDQGLEGTEEVLRNIEIYRRICSCTRHHGAILEYMFNKICFINEYEATFSTVTFTQLLASVIVICTSCFQLMTVSPGSFSFFFMIVYSNIMFVEIFLYCFYGTILYEESDSISTAIYLGQWYEFDMASKKALLTIMERSQRPVKVTAGKVLDLSLDTFANVLRKAYSVLAVLQRFQKN